MRRLLRFLLEKPLTWLANKLSSAPARETVFKSLTSLYKSRLKKNTKRICTLHTDASTARFIIFSDQHKGNRDQADDFTVCEPNYLAALAHYNSEGYTFINLGDSEELWKYDVLQVLPKQQPALAAEAAFLPGRYYKTFGNHDLLWKNAADVSRHLQPILKQPLPVYEGIIIQLKVNGKKLDLFATHGHQGDKMSDNNRFSTWVVAHIWTPLQRYLRINVNTPSNDSYLRNKHNQIMYWWSRYHKNILLVTGHTHVPVFASGKYSDHPNNNIRVIGEELLPTYFNTGCCCYKDGDITGVELSGGYIRLIRWKDGKPDVLEEKKLTELLNDL